MSGDGPIVDAEVLLADTLAASSHFQTLVGAANAAEASERIFHDELPRPEGETDADTLADFLDRLPFAVLWTNPEEGFAATAAAGGAHHEFIDSGELVVEVWKRVADADLDDDAAAARAFKREVGLVLTDLMELAGAAGYLAITRLRAAGPWRTHPDDAWTQGQALFARLNISWG